MIETFRTSRRAVMQGAFALALSGTVANCTKKGLTKIRYGVTPYQDSALPVVAVAKDWYKAADLDIQLVPLTWDQVIPAIASGAIDVAIYNFNSFIPPYANAAQTAFKPLFYAPLYVFKGQAIMVKPTSGLLNVANNGASPESLTRIAGQLRGKRIGITRGTELEQIVLATLKAGGLSERDVELIHASPDDLLAAFLAGDLYAFAAGLTERTEARRHGAVELVTQADVLSPVTDGLVTAVRFAESNQASLDALVGIWFKTIEYISSNVRENSVEIRDYLRKSASTVYSPEEYEIAWTFNVFPKTAKEATEMFEATDSKFNWRKSWDGVNQFLIEQKKISIPVPYEAYAGTGVLKRLSARSAAALEKQGRQFA